MASQVNWHDKELIANIQTTTKANLRKIGQTVSRKAKANCPVGVDIKGTAESGTSKGQTWTERTPGSLKKSIRYRVSRGKKLSVQVIAGNKNVFYAPFVEFGTSKMLARPFLRPALESSKMEIEGAFKDTLK